jgi:hypothetical protein
MNNEVKSLMDSEDEKAAMTIVHHRCSSAETVHALRNVASLFTFLFCVLWGLLLEKGILSIRL